MQLRHVKKVAKDAEVGLKGSKVKIVRDPELIGRNVFGYTHPNGNIDLYPDAFRNRETLVKTLGHERMHVYQLKTFGSPPNHLVGLEFEKAAWGSEDMWWSYYNRK